MTGRDRQAETGRDDGVGTEEETAETERVEGVACPLCGHDCDDRAHLRYHLNEGHAKSEVVDGYLDRLDV